MKVIEHIQRTTEPNFSFEIVPPPRGRSVKEIIDIAQALSTLEPAWIDVTSHASAASYHENSDGTLQRKTFKKRPGTLGICGIIQNRFKIDTVAHILCQGFSREETEDALIELNFLGIHNVMALRGDSPNYQKIHAKNKSTNTFAADLVRQLVGLRQGEFVEEILNSDPLDFCIGVAAYPEKHFEAPNLKTDLAYLKQKVAAGADYIVTQLFYDNKTFFDYVKACRDLGIEIPIVPGLKIFGSITQLKTIPKTFHIDLPDALVQDVVENPKHVEEIGIRWALKQTQELMDAGYLNIHYYIMNDTPQIVNLIQKLRKL